MPYGNYTLSKRDGGLREALNRKSECTRQRTATEGVAFGGGSFRSSSAPFAVKGDHQGRPYDRRSIQRSASSTPSAMSTLE